MGSSEDLTSLVQQYILAQQVQGLMSITNQGILNPFDLNLAANQKDK